MVEKSHSKTLDNIYSELKSTPHGLLSSDAADKLRIYGYNRLEAKKKISPWMLLLEQFKNVLIITLLTATTVSMFLGHGVEAIAIAVIVLFAVFLGFIQEYRAEKAIDALKNMAAPTAKVLRDGKEHTIAASDLVPGDVFLLAAGDRVPADGRLIHAANLRIEEASLTGESLASEKEYDLTLSDSAPLGDRKNMVFAGTSVNYGRGKAIAVDTGMKTEFGKIAKMLQQIETEKTPLQKNLDKVGVLLARVAIVIVLIIVALGLFRGQPFIEMLIFGIALAVAVVPEALPAVVTISLALGVQRMVKRNALMRRLPAVETLGSTTVICSDKTGTLTRDEMTVRSVFTSDTMLNVGGTGYIPEGKITPAESGRAMPATLTELLTAGILCNDSKLIKEDNAKWGITGDPTEAALLVLARKAELDEVKINALFPRIDEQPFSSETKRMITLHSAAGSTIAYIKGAPEVILADCAYIKTDTGVIPIDASGQKRILEKAGLMAANALRVLAIACKSDCPLSDAGKNMTFLGLAGMIDPPRAEAKEAVIKCRQSGIMPVMITGDHPVTAQAVARELGILSDGKVITGTQLQAMSDEELRSCVSSIQVFARVSPEHKLRIVDAFQKNGHIVAMTGDGVNDAPALKKANIGISMGITGTDVTKEASAMMLTDDNFASIVAAVEEGRGIYDNIKKYLTYLLSSNIGEIGLMAGATVLGIPLPLTAVQILYVNLATDGLPALALAVDPADRNIMRRKPNDPSKGIFTRQIMALMLAGGLWSTIVNLSLFQWARLSGKTISEAMTMTFASLVLIQFFKAYNFRSERESIFINPFANKWLNSAILWELVMLALVIYIPVLHKPFGTFSLTLEDWLIVGFLSLTVIPVIEVTKGIIRRGWFGLKNQ
jgi:Ca2+-transporting ATPase